MLRILLLAALLLALPSLSNAASINLVAAWTDNSTNEDGFSIERALGTGAFSEIHQTAANVTTYTDPNLAEKTTYCYRLRAFNSGGNSSYSNTACATTPQLPPNGTPGNVTVVIQMTPS